MLTRHRDFTRGLGGRMRMTDVLLLTTRVPFPAAGGASMRTRQIVSALMRHCTLTTLCIGPFVRGADPAALPKEAKWGLYPSQYPFRLRVAGKLGLKMFRRDLFPRARLREIGAHIRNCNPSLVLFDESRTANYLPAAVELQKPIVYISHNVDAYAMDVDLSGRDNGAKRVNEIAHNLEKRLIRNAVQIWACSENDRDLFRQLYGQTGEVILIPNAIDVSTADEHSIGRENILPKNHTILFPADFSYDPNDFGASYFLEHCWNDLRSRIPNADLVLAGRGPRPRLMSRAAKYANVTVTGPVKDMDVFFRNASVIVVPMFSGGGTRLKILEAFAHRRPVVSTTKGAEGIEVEDGKHLLIANSPSEIVQALVRTWSDPDGTLQRVEQAKNLVNNLYSWRVVGDKVRNAVDRIAAISSQNSRGTAFAAVDS